MVAQKETHLAISPRVIVFFSLCVLVPGIILVAKFGPVRARDQWQAIQKQARDSMDAVVTRGMQDYRTSKGYTGDRPQDLPHVENLIIDEPVMMWHLPERVPFQGSSNGAVMATLSRSNILNNFRGTYNTRTGEVEVEIDIDDAVLTVSGCLKNDKTIMHSATTRPAPPPPPSANNGEV